ncbi:MAG: hypothetical protein IJ189_01885 [Clostridia bacterium]|nr:hypothetical protein [Clostridia bacterium]
MRKRMVGFTLILSFTSAALLFLYAGAGARWAYPLLMTSGTTLYHFTMRLLVGLGLNGWWHNRLDGHQRWFQEKRWEPKLYQTLRVKAWKRAMPTFEPAVFDLSKRTLEEVIGAMCQAEVVHEVIILLSFLPLLTPFAVEDFFIFFITSLLAAAVDAVFVVMQRYNRPRLLELCRRREERARRNAREAT